MRTSRDARSVSGPELTDSRGGGGLLNCQRTCRSLAACSILAERARRFHHDLWPPPDAATGTASIRRRRLPAEQVVWLVIALALYRHQSMPEVLAALDLALPSATELPVSKSAVTQARCHQRL